MGLGKFFKKLRELSEQAYEEDPELLRERFGDPLAGEIKWSPASRGGSNFSFSAEVPHWVRIFPKIRVEASTERNMDGEISATTSMAYIREARPLNPGTASRPNFR